MKVHWGYLPVVGLCAGLGAMLATQMTMDQWSAHTSYDCQAAIHDYAMSNQGVLNKIDLTMTQLQQEVRSYHRAAEAAQDDLVQAMWQGIDLAHPDRKDRLKLERRLQALEHPDVQNLEQLP